LRAASHPRAPIEGGARKGGGAFPTPVRPPVRVSSLRAKGEGGTASGFAWAPGSHTPSGGGGGLPVPAPPPLRANRGVAVPGITRKWGRGCEKKGGRGAQKGGVPLPRYGPPVSVSLPARKPWGGRFWVCAWPPHSRPPFAQKGRGDRFRVCVGPPVHRPQAEAGDPCPSPHSPPFACHPCTQTGGLSRDPHSRALLGHKRRGGLPLPAQTGEGGGVSRADLHSRPACA